MVILQLPEKLHTYTHAVNGLACWLPWLKRNIQYFPVLFLVISFEHASLVIFFFFFSPCFLRKVVEWSGSGQYLWKLWPFTHTEVGLFLGWKSVDTVKLCNHNCFPGNTSVQSPSKSLLELARIGGLPQLFYLLEELGDIFNLWLVCSNFSLQHHMRHFFCKSCEQALWLLQWLAWLPVATEDTCHTQTNFSEDSTLLYSVVLYGSMLIVFN